MIYESTKTQIDIIYELPLNEAIRVCLRLENLFQEFDIASRAKTVLESRQAMAALLKIIEVVDRPDIKSKLSHTLTQYTTALSQLKQSPQVDTGRLTKTLAKLTALNHNLHTNHQRLDEALRHNEFLYQIRTQFSSPGGATNDRLPGYYLWQQQPAEVKSRELQHWISTFDNLRNIVKTIMQLTRDSAPFQATVADNGFYHKIFNPSQPYQLARIKLPVQQNLFPEFGAGKHRLTIRFLSPEYHDKGRSKQTNLNVPFEISFCKL